MTQKIKNLLIAVYVLLILGISASARAQMRFQPVEQPQLKTYIGEIAIATDDSAYLIIDENRYYQLAATVDLKELNGMRVSIEGMIIKHKVGPVFELMSMDPLLIDQRERKATNVLVVYAIRELTE